MAADGGCKVLWVNRAGFVRLRQLAGTRCTAMGALVVVTESGCTISHRLCAGELPVSVAVHRQGVLMHSEELKLHMGEIVFL